jgi:hypothetical protein
MKKFTVLSFLIVVALSLIGCLMEPSENPTDPTGKATVTITISNIPSTSVSMARAISLTQWNAINTWKYGIAGSLTTGTKVEPFDCEIGSQTITIEGYKDSVLYVHGSKTQTLTAGDNTVAIQLVADIDDDYDPEDHVPVTANVSITANAPKVVQRLSLTNEELRSIVFETDTTTYLSDLDVTEYSSWTSVRYTARVMAFQGTTDTSVLKSSGTIYKTLWELSQTKLKSLGWVNIEETETFNLAPVEVKALTGTASFSLSLDIDVHDTYRSGYVSWQFSDDNHKSPNSVILMYHFSDLVYNETLDKWLGATATDFI